MSSDAGQTTMTLTNRRRLPGDVVIHSPEPGAYVIATIDGEEIGTSHDRLDAMRRACAAARLTGSNVWIRVEDSSNPYHEVLCP
jgi:hypothetical protein